MQTVGQRRTDVVLTAFYDVRKGIYCGLKVTQDGPKLTSNRRPTDVLNWTVILGRPTDV